MACKEFGVDISILLILAAVLFVVVVVAISAEGDKTLSVEAKPLLTKREREALRAIEAALPQHRVHAQVAMGALIKVKAGLSAKTRASTRNRFAQKIVDFVAEDRRSGELLLIEVDDRTHNASKDKQRDAITVAAGYRTIRIPAGTRLSPDTVRGLVFPDEHAASQASRAPISLA